MPTDFYEVLKETAIAHAKAYDNPRPWDPNDVWKYRTEDCLHSLHPNANLPEPFNKPLDKEAFFGALNFLGAVMHHSRFEIKDTVVDVPQRKVLLYLDGIYDLKAVGNEAAVQGWRAEYMWLMEFDDTGRKIKRVYEFLDSERLMKSVLSRAERFAELQVDST